MGFARGCWYPLRERCRPGASRPGALAPAHRIRAEVPREIFTRIEASTIVGVFQGDTTRVAHEFQIRPARAGVLDRVVEGLLGDAIEGLLGLQG
jgi:hypothetical protein